MVVDTLSFSQRATALKSIFGVAQSMAEELERYGVSLQPQSTLPSVTIPALDLPFPHDILSWLESACLSPIALERSTIKLRETVTKLKGSLTQAYEGNCRKIIALNHPSGPPASVLVNELRETFRKLYTHRYLPWLKAQIITAHEARQNLLKSKSIDVKKTQFNHEFTPVLEFYFQYNAFPSKPDREKLAEVGGMNVEQIVTWFQNHRRRARNRGEFLRRLQNHSLPVDISLESLRSKAPLYFNSENENHQDKTQIDAEESSDEEPVVYSVIPPSNAIDTLDVPAPPHAYPAKRGQDFGYQPFPKDENGNSIMRFPPPEWRRKPATPPKSTSLIDLDELSENFNTMLHLRKYSKKRPERVGMSDVELMRAGMVCWFASRVTVPSIAPHPALVRYTMTASISPTPSYSSRSRSQSLKPATPTPASKSITSQGRRMAGLPKRIPKHAPAVHGSDSSTTANSPSPSTSTRSLSSSSTRSASSSSSSSCTLSTPPSSPQTFPEIAIVDLCTVNDENEEFINHLFPGGFTIPSADSLIPGGYSAEKWDLGVQSFIPYFGTSLPGFVQVQS